MTNIVGTSGTYHENVLLILNKILIELLDIGYSKSDGVLVF